MESYHGIHKLWYPALLDALTNCQRFYVKDHLVDTNNSFNGIFPSFSSLHSELSPSLRIIDNFSDRFSFNLCNKEKMIKYTSNNLTTWLLSHLIPHLQPLLSWMLVSRTTLLHLFCTCIHLTVH